MKKLPFIIIIAAMMSCNANKYVYQSKEQKEFYKKIDRKEKLRHLGFNVIAITVWISLIKVATKLADGCKSCT